MSIKRVAKSLMLIGLGILYFSVTNVFAEGPADIGTIAKTLGGTFKSVGQLMAATAYLAGFGLTIASIFKFKQHKDNPQQVPMGTPIAMLLVGISLIFLPNIIQPAGQSIFGSGATVGGFTGTGVEKIPGGSDGGGDNKAP